MRNLLKKLGPGLLFAGAAIGVSHLVQATKAGAVFGTGLLWAMLLVHLFKYPTFEFGTRYTAATGNTILHGYKKLGRWVLPVYIVVTLATMFTIQAAITIVTAGIAEGVFGLQIDIKIWSLVILLISALVLLLGKFSLFDNLIKVIVICLSLTTVIALLVSVFNPNNSLQFTTSFPKNVFEISFLIAFMGWMPAPLDVSVWQSVWVYEKAKNQPKLSLKTSLFDFNLGYIGTLLIGICFLLMGALVMHGTNQEFSASGVGFANQFLNMYTSTLGSYAFAFIGLAALTCMFSTTITALDASPRALAKAIELVGFKIKNGYQYCLVFLSFGTIAILFFMLSEMALLVKIATIVSFLTAPFYAILNYFLIFGKHSTVKQPKPFFKYLSISGILFLIGFGLWYVTTLFN